LLYTLEHDLKSATHVEASVRDLHRLIYLPAVLGGALRSFFVGELLVEHPLSISRFVFACGDCDVLYRHVRNKHPDFVGVLSGRNDFIRVDAFKSELVCGTSRRPIQRNPLPFLLVARLSGLGVRLRPLCSNRVLMESGLLNAFRGTASKSEHNDDDGESHQVLPVTLV